MEITIKLDDNGPALKLWRMAKFTSILLAFSVLIGTTLNHLREHPLEVRYVPKAERNAALTVATVDAKPTSSAVPKASSALMPEVTPVEEIDFAKFEEVLKTSSPLLVDARSGEAFASGHAPQSLNLNMNSFDKDFLREQPRLQQARGSDVVVYCSGETCGASIMVARSLALFGFHKLYVFKGGWNDWIKHNMPVTR